MPPALYADRADYGLDAHNMVSVLEAALAPGGIVDSLGLSATSRQKLESDLAAAIAIEDTMANGGGISNADVRKLRDGTQHIMCYAAPYYPESLCNQF